jgi:hypothetical protein
MADNAANLDARALRDAADSKKILVDLGLLVD